MIQYYLKLVECRGSFVELTTTSEILTVFIHENTFPPIDNNTLSDDDFLNSKLRFTVIMNIQEFKTSKRKSGFEEKVIILKDIKRVVKMY